MRRLSSLILLLFLLLMLPLLVFLAQKTQKYLSRATGTPAKIIVDTQTNLGPLPEPWKALAQGGEEKEKMLTSTIPLVKALSPQYIRIDHIYDYYKVVTKNPKDKLVFDFSKLDQTVDDILATNAKPMLSLSYMPLAISAGEITDEPKNWLDWQEVVRKTVEHYSGKENKNLADVSYEVWNEPDLFGNWKTYGKKDYRLLYLYAAKGAAQAKETNSFKIGGPATTAFYKNWLDELIQYVYQNKLRFDFFSWHKYSQNPEDFRTDVDYLDSLLARHGGSYLLPKYLTEWGSDSENSPKHDTNFDAAHAVAVIRRLLDRTELIFSFEIKDGPPPKEQVFWGRWGMLTHESVGLKKKPKYLALELLTKMGGQRLNLTGEGSWVTGFAAKEEETIKIILTNYDQDENHNENIPVTFTNLNPGNYKFKQTNLDGTIFDSVEVVSEDQLTKNIFLPVNNVVLLELKP
ncbi:MAG: glycosyl hydrolase [Patescibacteria group bacterium]|nr:glycosyl hydrolase [Patescibacteria group bacterium]